jgi:hypothetical protein
MGLIDRFFGGGVRAQIDNCARVVGLALATHLYERCANQHEHEIALSLASAVTNELFGAPPANEAGRAFLASNKPLVEAALRDIKSEPRICYIVSVVTHMRGNVAGNTGIFSSDLLQFALRLRELGILLPIDQIQMPTSPDVLMQQAREFEHWVVERSHGDHAA